MGLGGDAFVISYQIRIQILVVEQTLSKSEALSLLVDLKLLIWGNMVFCTIFQK
jgi:hypothetical protein